MLLTVLPDSHGALGISLPCCCLADAVTDGLLLAGMLATAATALGRCAQCRSGPERAQSQALHLDPLPHSFGGIVTCSARSRPQCLSSRPAVLVPAARLESRPPAPAVVPSFATYTVTLSAVKLPKHPPYPFPSSISVRIRDVARKQDYYDQVVRCRARNQGASRSRSRGAALQGLVMPRVPQFRPMV